MFCKWYIYTSLGCVEMLRRRQYNQKIKFLIKTIKIANIIGGYTGVRNSLGKEVIIVSHHMSYNQTSQQIRVNYFIIV